MLYQVILSLDGDKASFASLSDEQVANLAKKLTEGNGLHNPLFLFFASDAQTQIPSCLKSGQVCCVVDLSLQDPFAEAVNKLNAGKYDCVIVAQNSSGRIIVMDAKNEVTALSDDKVLAYYEFLDKMKINKTVELTQEELNGKSHSSSNSF